MRSFLRVSKFRVGMLFALLAVLLLGVLSVGAQATVVPLSISTIQTSAESFIVQYGLEALIAIAAAIGVAFMIVRRFRRAAM